MRKIQNSVHPDDELHYERMGLKKNEVALWEDGSRVDGSRGCYEWWYYDSHYPDGTVLVLFFFWWLVKIILGVEIPAPKRDQWEGLRHP